MRVPQETYELTAMFMRYWFIFLMLIITFRAFRWLMNERRSYRRTLAALPDAGLIGEVVDLRTGESYPLQREGIISSRSYADIRLKMLKYQAINFQYVENKGVRMTGRGRNRGTFLEGEPLSRGQYALHGSRLVIPPYELRFRLFEGLNVPERRPAELASWDADAAAEPRAESFWPLTEPSADDYAYSDSLDATWPFALDMRDAYTAQSNYEHAASFNSEGETESDDVWGNLNGED